MTFRMGLLSRPIRCNEVLRYIVRGLHCVVARGAPVPADYILNVVACADRSNDFNYSIFRCDIALWGYFGSGRI